MILTDIENELDACCDGCTKECERYACICYRIRQMINANIRPLHLNIDDFFAEGEFDGQINFFEDDP